jgi:tyrosyl-tRNA synthetase
VPILAGTDGVEKMSKSLDNYIGINESPREIYGKTLSIPDALIYQYFVLATGIPLAELPAIKAAIPGHPRDTKRRLAREIVALYHSAEDARAAQEEFDRVFIERQLPDDIPEYTIQNGNDDPELMTLLVDTKLASSRSEARRLIEQGGVSVDGQTVADRNAHIPLLKPVVIKVGKLRFVKVQRSSH